MTRRRGRPRSHDGGAFRAGRRSLLVALAVGLGQALVPRRSWGRGDEAVRRLAALRHDGVPFACDRAAAAAVGCRYLAAHPHEADAARLAAHLGFDDRSVQRDDRHLRAQFNDLRRGEFARGQTVLVDGWILARSEARLCALIALRQATS